MAFKLLELAHLLNRREPRPYKFLNLFLASFSLQPCTKLVVSHLLLNPFELFCEILSSIFHIFDDFFHDLVCLIGNDLTGIVVIQKRATSDYHPILINLSLYLSLIWIFSHNTLLRRISFLVQFNMTEVVYSDWADIVLFVWLVTFLFVASLAW